MARYVVLASLDPRNIPSYYIVDTSNNSRVRRYDCQVWAEHEARRMTMDMERNAGEAVDIEEAEKRATEEVVEERERALAEQPAVAPTRNDDNREVRRTEEGGIFDT